MNANFELVAASYLTSTRLNVNRSEMQWFGFLRFPYFLKSRILSKYPVVGNTIAGNTITVSVKAVSSVSFTADQTVYHNGPVSVYMAKALTTAAEIDGSGDVWFKILYWPKIPRRNMGLA
jgi:hypothetical protein